MLIINGVAELAQQIESLKVRDKTIGFVPTMGALHDGHGSLVQQSIRENNITVVSIFVNPRQFNNLEDLKKYPRTEEKDIQFLEKTGVDIVFIPSVEEMYSVDFVPSKIDLGRLENLMEGKMRPGHFDGVIQVLTRLFQLVQPHRAYFGLKDFQQVAVVNRMVKLQNSSIEIVSCPIYREPSGLAYSSRNLRLSENEKGNAVFIYRSLIKAKELAKTLSPSEIVTVMQNDYANSDLELEYFEIVHPETLESLSEQWTENAVACVVAHLGGVRLIDNMVLT